MSEDILNKFVDKKNADSAYISLGDGESVRIKRLADIKMITKSGFGGEEKEVLRLVCDVDTSEGVRSKMFDNGTARFAKELVDKKIGIGSAFTLTRSGLQVKTRYNISEVKNHPANEVSNLPDPLAEGAANM